MSRLIHALADLSSWALSRFDKPILGWIVVDVLSQQLPARRNLRVAQFSGVAEAFVGGDEGLGGTMSQQSSTQNVMRR